MGDFSGIGYYCGCRMNTLRKARIRKRTVIPMQCSAVQCVLYVSDCSERVICEYVYNSRVEGIADQRGQGQYEG